MNKSPRDTQFMGFAKLLLKDMLEEQDIDIDSYEGTNWWEPWEEVLARRAYDFAIHVIDNSRSNDMEDWETERIMPYVPDMNELPKDAQ